MMAMRRNKLLWLAAVLLCLLTVAPKAAAAQSGSLKITGIEETVGLYHAARPDGTLTEAFAGAPVEDLADQSKAVFNANTLLTYARSNSIPALSRTPDGKGEARYDPLEEGVYLVCSLSREAEFDPFLVTIPTVINGEAIYHVEAEPKQEETEPTTGPTEPKPTEPEPEIPQTGVNVWPKYILLALGVAVTLMGLYNLIRGKEDRV